MDEAMHKSLAKVRPIRGDGEGRDIWSCFQFPFREHQSLPSLRGANGGGTSKGL